MKKNVAARRIRFKRIQVFIVLTILFGILVSGCSIRHDYEWAEHRIQASRIKASDEFAKKSFVSIINAQETKDEMIFADVGVHKFYGSLDQLTEAVITQLKRELRKRNITVKSDASKIIRIKASKTNFERGMWKVRANLDVHLQAGDHYAKDISVSNSTPAGIYQAFDGAVALAVIEILNNPDVRAYLQE